MRHYAFVVHDQSSGVRMMTRLHSLFGAPLAIAAAVATSLVVTGCASSVKCATVAVASPIVTVTLPDGQSVCDASVVGTDGPYKVQFPPAAEPGGGCPYQGPFDRPGSYTITVRHGRAVKVVQDVRVDGVVCGVTVVHVPVTIAS